MCEFFRKERALRLFTAAVITVLYGVRLTQGDVFVDSDIMITDPAELMFSWYGHGRFGMNLTKMVFGQFRLIPYLENVMFMIALWAVAVGICFCIHEWSEGETAYGKGAFLFVGLFLSSPCLAEQFHFLLQAFESTAAMAYCVIAVYCSGKWIYDRKNVMWAVLALVFMVWAFGSYQAYPPFYIALVLISYMTVFLHRKEGCGLREGLMHVGMFVAGFAISQICAMVTRQSAGASSGYVDQMFRWGTDSTEQCIASIMWDVRRIYMAEWPVFFSRWFRYVGAAALGLALFHGWRKKSRKFWCFCLAVLLLPVTPLLVTLITAMNQPMRSQMTYSLVYAYVFLLFYVGIRMLKWDRRVLEMCRQAAGVMVIVLVIGLGWKQGVTVCQLWETAHESYVADVLTANRMYADICKAADRTDMENCKVVFLGSRTVQLAGEPVLGDVIGHSFFEWDADSSVGVSTRVSTFFRMLGMPVWKKVTAEEYQRALGMEEELSVWPAAGSVGVMEDGIVVVKLSEVR